jgi:hypothetical protein
VIKAFDKKGPHAGKFSVKYKDDPNWLKSLMNVVKSVSDGLLRV